MFMRTDDYHFIEGKHMRKYWISLLVVCLILCMLPVLAYAEGEGVMQYSWADKIDGSNPGSATATSFEEGWNDVMRKCNEGNAVQVTLNADWIADEEHRFTDATYNGPGFDNNTICVSQNAELVLDLNGHTIDRGLRHFPKEEPNCEADGEVIYVDENADFTLKNGKIMGGFSNNGGSGLHINGGNVTLENVTIADCFTHCNDGVAIYLEGGRLTVRDCTLKQNFYVTPYCYGVIFVNDAQSLTLENTTFEDYEFRQDDLFYARYGGTAYIDGCDSVIIENCTFDQTAAAMDGGAIWADAVKDLTVLKSTFQGCASLSGNGGAIYAEDSTVYINGCTFADCKAEVCGGAVYLYDCQSDISECVLRNNSSQKQGGALYTDALTSGEKGAKTRLEGCQFTSNGAGGDGGAVYINGSSICNSYMEMLETKLTGNNSGGQGGAICLQTGNYLTADNCTITGNTSLRQGGGIYAQNAISISQASLTVSGNTVIKDNTGADGRVDNLYLEYYSNLVLKNVTAADHAIGLRHPGEELPMATLRGENKLSAVFSDNPEWALEKRTETDVDYLYMVSAKTGLKAMIDDGSLFLILALAVVLIGGGVTVFLVAKKKKKS